MEERRSMGGKGAMCRVGGGGDNGGAGADASVKTMKNDTPTGRGGERRVPGPEREDKYGE